MDTTIVIYIMIAMFAVLFAGIAHYAIDAHNRVEKLEDKVRELETRK